MNTEINGKTRVFGIFGSPVQHSLSPQLHNAVFKKSNINAIYVPFEVKPNDLGEALDQLKMLQMGGVNLTLPHKESAIKFVDAIPRAVDRGIGAINTIHIEGGFTHGYNTDGPGFIEDLQDSLNFNVAGSRVLLVGAGGAARAIAFYLIKEECAELLIYNRTPERAKGLAEYLSNFFKSSHIRAVLSIDEIKEERIQLLVNASSCGMKPEDPFPISPEILARVEHLYDIIYHPKVTKLVREAKKRKIPIANGIGMLIRQALLAENIWYPDLNQAKTLKILKEAYRQCRW